MDEAVKQVQVRKVRQLYALLDGAGCRAARPCAATSARRASRPAACATCAPDPSETIDATVAGPEGPLGRGPATGRPLSAGAGWSTTCWARPRTSADWESALSTWGIGQELSAEPVARPLEQLLFEGLLREDPNDGRPLVGVGDAEAVRAVFRGDQRVTMRKHPDGAEDGPRPRRSAGKTRTPPLALPPTTSRCSRPCAPGAPPRPRPSTCRPT